jgi:hypothetical protein
MRLELGLLAVTCAALSANVAWHRTESTIDGTAVERIR